MGKLGGLKLISNLIKILREKEKFVKDYKILGYSKCISIYGLSPHMMQGFMLFFKLGKNYSYDEEVMHEVHQMLKLRKNVYKSGIKAIHKYMMMYKIIKIDEFIQGFVEIDYQFDKLLYLNYVNHKNKKEVFKKFKKIDKVIKSFRIYNIPDGF